jgi:hypothetical protein
VTKRTYYTHDVTEAAAEIYQHRKHDYTYAGVFRHRASFSSPGWTLDINAIGANTIETNNVGAATYSYSYIQPQLPKPRLLMQRHSFLPTRLGNGCLLRVPQIRCSCNERRNVNHCDGRHIPWRDIVVIHRVGCKSSCRYVNL